MLDGDFFPPFSLPQHHLEDSAVFLSVCSVAKRYEVKERGDHHDQAQTH